MTGFGIKQIGFAGNWRAHGLRLAETGESEASWTLDTRQLQPNLDWRRIFQAYGDDRLSYLAVIDRKK